MKGVVGPSLPGGERRIEERRGRGAHCFLALPPEISWSKVGFPFRIIVTNSEKSIVPSCAPTRPPHKQKPAAPTGKTKRRQAEANGVSKG